VSQPIAFEIDRAKRVAKRDGEVVKLSSRAYDLLAALHERRGRLVTKDELIDIVWPDVIVEENNLHVHVSALRRAFGHDALVTIPGRGYQWSLEQTSFDATSNRPTQSGDRSKNNRYQEVNKSLLSPELIGRAADVLEVVSMLDRERWLAIIGAGGIGKTSLTRAVIAERNEPSFWIDLTAIDSAEHIDALVAKSVSIAIPLDREVRSEVMAVLSKRSAVLVFDNCEHLARAVESWIADLLNQAPGIKVLATSQETFRSALAKTYRLDALALPAADASIDEIRASAAVELLETRARAENHRFTIADSDLPLAAQLCRELDGMPLAIEMAAVRLPLLGVSGLLERLGDRIKLFRSKFPDVPPRQQTLRGAFDWGFSLLVEREQRMLLLLSEFVGGFRLDAAQLVATSNGFDAFDALDTLDVLIEKSLARLESNDPVRYRIPETARLYAQERLQAEGLKAIASKTHAQAMATIASEAQRKLVEINDEPWLRDLFPDYANMEVALAYGAAHRDAKVIAATAQSLLSMDDVQLLASGNMRERIRIAYEACAYADAPTRALLMNSVATTPLVPDPVLSRKEAARLRVEAWQDQNDPEQLGYAWARYAYNCASTGDLDTARSALAAYEAIDASKFSPRTHLRIVRLNSTTYGYLGDSTAKLQCTKSALAMCEASGSKARTARAVMEVGDSLFNVGQYDEAARVGERAIVLLTEVNVQRALLLAHCNTVTAYCFVGNIDRARAFESDDRVEFKW
jgi:predicted ATPase/DNA-binding winged helix-turn-helix (wHTH) protein